MIGLSERFWAKVSKEDGCWLWTGTTNLQGYGSIRVGRRMRKATHVAIMLATGEWPPASQVVCHRCDNPRCVRQDHLFVASQKDNCRDRDKKGRGSKPPGCPPDRRARGVEHGLSRLTPEQVLRIRGDAGSRRAVALKYGVSTTAIQNILSRRTWTHV